MDYHRTMYLQPLIATAALGLAWCIIAFYIGKPISLDEVQFSNVLSEGITCIIAFFWLYVSLSLNVRRETYFKLIIGFSLLFLGLLQDLLDELIQVDAIASTLLEDIGIPSGMLFVGVGLYEVGRAYQINQLLLGRHREKEKNLSTTDQLTNLFNRGYFFSLGPQFIKATISTDNKLSVLIFSIRDLERINHDYSFQAGDDVLVKLAGILHRNSRTRDLATRLSGRQFAILLANTNEDGALSIAKRIQDEAEQIRVTDADGQQVVATLNLSYGLASHQKGDTIDTLLQKAEVTSTRSKRRN